MSDSAFKHWKEGRRLCQRCRDRKARFRYRGAVRADRDHTLCFECFRSQREQSRAHRLTAVAGEPRWRGAPGSPVVGPAPALAERQVAHRRQMLAHLERVVAR